MDTDGENMDRKLSRIVHTLGNYKQWHSMEDPLPLLKQSQ